jgi:hypothetical protein
MVRIVISSFLAEREIDLLTLSHAELENPFPMKMSPQIIRESFALAQKSN